MLRTQIREKLGALKLSNAAVMAREQRRIARDGDFETPMWVKAPFIALCWVLDVVYDNRPIQVGRAFGGGWGGEGCGALKRLVGVSWPERIQVGVSHSALHLSTFRLQKFWVLETVAR